MATPYMNLTLPVVGPLGTQGPDWATEINAALTLIDQHDHSSGLGKQITPAGININQTFQMSSNQISEIASLALDNLASQPASANLVYEYAGELYFNDANANQVQLTSGGTINVASIGTISGDYGGSNPANVSFSNLTQTYLFTKSPGETGSIACGPVFIYQNTAGSFYAQIQQNVAQASNLDWTLPVDYPLTKLPMKSSAGGVLELSQIVTSEIADAQVTAIKLATDSVETLKIKDLNVTTGKLADQAVTAAKIANQTITFNQIASNTITSGQIASNTILDANVYSAANIKRSKLRSQLLFYSTPNVSTTNMAFVTAASGSITPESNLVRSVAQNNNLSSPGLIQLFATTSGNFYAEFKLTIGSSSVYKKIGGDLSNSQNFYYDLSVLDSVFAVVSGVPQSVLLQYRSSSSFLTVSIINSSFYIFEY